MKSREEKLKKLNTESLEVKAEVATLLASIVILVLLTIVFSIQK